ncbi:MAG: 4Fe-4S dicluster domain-containing protein [Bacillota bacterium]
MYARFPYCRKSHPRFSLLKVKIDPGEMCIDCGMCEKVCPMDVKLLEYKNNDQRVLSTECIWCGTCTYECPQNAVASTIGLGCRFQGKD